jgi:hypothetical protein
LVLMVQCSRHRFKRFSPIHRLNFIIPALLFVIPKAGSEVS